ncbi:hypothetical protein AYO49_00950 [Verrucomicrobiaceae bacterium SCGC AG-212-N21]|nr:hypothetical protein AYO49_00950 [Verrucomicrobiaceae bacterium SCGC AG-212-N21]
MKPEHYCSLQISRRGFLRRVAPTVAVAAATTHTLRDLRLISSAMAADPITDYKALVCIFLNGGNDANNWFIPTNSTEYASYAAIRTPVLAIPNTDGSPATALALNPLNNDGHTYGIHPACPELQALFNNGRMAPVFNVGTLVYPLTKAQYVANSPPRPPQLFSHSDQVSQWQTSLADQPPSTGWGGRVADVMDYANGAPSPLSLCITLAGSNTFEVGGVVQQYAVGTGGVTSITTFNNPNSTAGSARNATLNSILSGSKTRPNLLVSNYAGALSDSLATGSSLSNALNSSQIASYWTTVANWSATGTDLQVVTPNGGRTFGSGLMSQLRMIAKIIEASSRAAGVSNGLGMKRQIFFCQVGGYDTHTNQTNASNTTPTPQNVIVGSHADLLAEVSQCIHRFYNAMGAIGTAQGDPNFINRVTSFTASDFGRTFPCNSLGSDHGWGSHQIVVGGAVQGRRTYGKWPVLTVNGPDDTSTGRWIPSTAVDQFSATLAKWFGVGSSNMAKVFPNLSRFSTPDLGFMG